MTNKCMEPDETLDEESWNWLVDNHLKVAASLEIAVQRGATPTEIRGRVLKCAGPTPLSLLHVVSQLPDQRLRLSHLGFLGVAVAVAGEGVLAIALDLVTPYNEMQETSFG